MIKSVTDYIRNVTIKLGQEKVEGIKIFFSAPNPKQPGSNTLDLKEEKAGEANFQWLTYQILFKEGDKYYIYSINLKPEGSEQMPDKVFESDSNWSGKNKDNPTKDMTPGDVRRNYPKILKGPNLFPEKLGQTIYVNTSLDDKGKSYSSQEFKKFFDNDFYIVLNPQKKELKNPFKKTIGIKYPKKEEEKK